MKEIDIPTIDMMVTTYRDLHYDAVITLIKDSNLFLGDDIDNRKTWNKKANLDPYSIWVAITLKDKEVIGCMFLQNDPWISTIRHLAVKEAYRKQRIGSYLLHTAEYELRDSQVI